MLVYPSRIQAPNEVQVSQCERQTAKLVSVPETAARQPGSSAYASHMTTHPIQKSANSTRCTPDVRSRDMLRRSHTRDGFHMTGRGLITTSAENSSQSRGQVPGATRSVPIRLNDSQKA